MLLHSMSLQRIFSIENTWTYLAFEFSSIVGGVEMSFSTFGVLERFPAI